MIKICHLYREYGINSQTFVDHQVNVWVIDYIVRGLDERRICNLRHNISYVSRIENIDQYAGGKTPRTSQDTYGQLIRIATCPCLNLSFELRPNWYVIWYKMNFQTLWGENTYNVEQWVREAGGAVDCRRITYGYENDVD